MEFTIIIGLLLFIVGLAGALKPEQSLRFWFLGLLNKEPLTERGQTFFRGLGVLCMTVGIAVAIGI